MRLPNGGERDHVSNDPSGSPGPRDNPTKQRYELVHDGQTSTLAYSRAPGLITLIHTEVPLAQRGQGLGASLVEFALAAARDAGERVVARCPFVQWYLRTHATDGFEPPTQQSPPSIPP